MAYRFGWRVIWVVIVLPLITESSTCWLHFSSARRSGRQRPEAVLGVEGRCEAEQKEKIDRHADLIDDLDLCDCSNYTVLVRAASIDTEVPPIDQQRTKRGRGQLLQSEKRVRLLLAVLGGCDLVGNKSRHYLAVDASVMS